jgi:hypothetical protein
MPLCIFGVSGSFHHLKQTIKFLVKITYIMFDWFQPLHKFSGRSHYTGSFSNLFNKNASTAMGEYFKNVEKEKKNFFINFFHKYHYLHKYHVHGKDCEFFW